MALLPALCLCLLLCSLQSGSEVIRKTVREDQDVVLDCGLDRTDLTNRFFDWKKTGGSEVFLYNRGRGYFDGLFGQDPNFKGRVFHFPEQLRVGNASILIRKTTLTDNGNYTCLFPKPEPQIGAEIRAQYELIVEYILKPRPVEGAAQQPFITLNKTRDGVLLQCVVRRASPRPRVEWRDSSGNVLQAEETVTHKDSSFDVHLTTIVNRSGFYRCVATQEEIYNQVYTETYVVPPEPGTNNQTSSDSPTGLIIALSVSVVVVLVLLAVLVLFCIKSNSGNGSQTRRSETTQQLELLPVFNSNTG